MKKSEESSGAEEGNELPICQSDTTDNKAALDSNLWASFFDLNTHFSLSIVSRRYLQPTVEIMPYKSEQC